MRACSALLVVGVVGAVAVVVPASTRDEPSGVAEDPWVVSVAVG